MSPAGPVTGVGALAPFVSELDRLAPSFDVRGDQIRIIKTPAEFYETLKVRRDGLRGGARRLATTDENEGNIWG